MVEASKNKINQEN
jgi:hypothetical protein